jgi:hypothetical protein
MDHRASREEPKRRPVTVWGISTSRKIRGPKQQQRAPTEAARPLIIQPRFFYVSPLTTERLREIGIFL